MVQLSPEPFFLSTDAYFDVPSLSFTSSGALITVFVVLVHILDRQHDEPLRVYLKKRLGRNDLTSTHSAASSWNR